MLNPLIPLVVNAFNCETFKVLTCAVLKAASPDDPNAAIDAVFKAPIWVVVSAANSEVDKPAICSVVKPLTCALVNH